LNAIQVNLHFVILEDLPGSAELDLAARLTIIRDFHVDEPLSDDHFMDPQQGK
jgi:hypothetical protein